MLNPRGAEPSRLKVEVQGGLEPGHELVANSQEGGGNREGARIRAKRVWGAVIKGHHGRSVCGIQGCTAVGASVGRLFSSLHGVRLADFKNHVDMRGLRYTRVNSGVGREMSNSLPSALHTPRIMPHTVTRIGRSYEHFSDGFEFHLLAWGGVDLQPGDELCVCVCVCACVCESVSECVSVSV